MMNFLKRSDYEQSIQDVHLEQILDVTLDTVLEQAELAALAEMQSYLRGVFDIDAIFMTIYDWSATDEYSLDDFVWYNNLIYQAKNDIVSSGTGMTIPSNDTVNWKLNDPRHAWLKQMLIHIVLYHIHDIVSPREVPKQRLVNYDKAIYNLKMIRDGELSTDLPTIESPVTSPTISGDARNTWQW
jgi:hypothetical protein